MAEPVLPKPVPKIATPEPLSLPEQFRQNHQISDAHHAALRAELPKEAIERTSGSKTGKGYDTTGYGYQWIADRFDEVFGPEHWRETRVVIATESIPWGKDGTGLRTVVESTIEVGYWVNAEGRVSQFCVVARHSHYGGHDAKAPADAYKGGATNAFKKCAAFGYGVGSDAWRNAIDEDNQDSASGAEGRPVSTSSIAPPLDVNEWDGTALVPAGKQKGKQFKDIVEDDLLYWRDKMTLDNKKLEGNWKAMASAEILRRRFSQGDDIPF